MDERLIPCEAKADAGSEAGTRSKRAVVRVALYSRRRAADADDCSACAFRQHHRRWQAARRGGLRAEAVFARAPNAPETTLGPARGRRSAQFALATLAQFYEYTYLF